MGRRWIVAGLLLVAVLAALAVLLPGRADEPFPPVVWYCAATDEVRATPQGERLSTMFIGAAPATADRHARGFIYRPPSLLQRLRASVMRSPMAVDGEPIHGTGVFESADGCSWERFELGLESPTPR